MYRRLLWIFGKISAPTERIRIAAKRRMFANAKSVGADKIVANNQKSANAKTGGAEPRPTERTK